MPSSGSTPFKSALSEAIDEGLLILGGEGVKQAFFYQVGKRGVQRSEIPVKLGMFHKILTDIFDSGALILERMIARVFTANWELSLKCTAHGLLNSTPDWPNRTAQNSIQLLSREKYANRVRLITAKSELLRNLPS